MNDLNALRTRAAMLHLHGLTAHWSEIADAAWVAPFLAWAALDTSRRPSAPSDPNPRSQRRSRSTHSSPLSRVQEATADQPCPRFVIRSAPPLIALVSP